MFTARAAFFNNTCVHVSCSATVTILSRSTGFAADLDMFSTGANGSRGQDAEFGSCNQKQIAVDSML